MILQTLCTAEFGSAQSIVRSIVLDMCEMYACKFVCLFVHMSECLFVGMHSDLYTPLCLLVCLQYILNIFKTRFTDSIIQDYGFMGAVTYFCIGRTCLYMYSYNNEILLDLQDN